MFKNIYFIIYIAGLLFFLPSCDQKDKDVAAVNQNKIETEKQYADKISQAKTNLNQAFSYISSAKATDKNEIKEKLLKNAEIELTNAISLNPSYLEALLNRGIIYMDFGQFNKAEEDFKKALSINPKDPSLNYNIACLYSLTDKLDLAADYLDHALEYGFKELDSLRNDPDISKLRSSKDFKKIMDKYKIFIN